MLVWLIVTSLALGAQAQGGLPFCPADICNCSPPRNSEAPNTYLMFTDYDPETGEHHPCTCHCGNVENEGCILGQCSYGLRCLHSKHTHTNGGNICRPLCLDPSEYLGKTYTSCEIDTYADTAIVVPRFLTCSEYASPISATRLQYDGHTAHLSFLNPCQMSNANAELIAASDMGGKWHIEFNFSP